MILTIDFETFWSTEYTLSKMTTEAYVRDERFHVHMVGLKVGDKPTVILTHEEFKAVAKATNWSKTAILCQNTAFDGLILSHHYGVRPGMWLDTMSMFRAVFPEKRASLKVIAETLGLKAKGGESGYNIVNTKGKERLTEWEFSQCAEYCKDDCDIAYSAFEILKGQTPVFELRLIDHTIRLFTEPKLLLNPELLREEIAAEQERKAKLMARIEHERDLLTSNPKFAALLETYAIQPPVKISPTALKKDADLKKRTENLPINQFSVDDMAAMDIPWAYAFGKSDQAMKALLQHDNPDVQALVAARIGVKSTIAETRAVTLLEASTRGLYPALLSYCGAHTSRWAGGNGAKANIQNLPRGSRLRQAFEAPEGSKLVVCDLAGIEARVVSYLAGQEDNMETFRTGGDIYCDMAASVYQRPITKKDKTERQVGKLLILSCGYGTGARKFAEGQYLTHGNLFALPMAETLGVNIDLFWHKEAKRLQRSKPITLTIEQWMIHSAISDFLVTAYRTKNNKIIELWGRGDMALEAMYTGQRIVPDVAGITWTTQNQINAPIGNPIRYNGLQKKVEGRKVEFTRNSREGKAHLWGGTWVENVTQWISRHILAEQILQLEKEGLHIAFTCHDEIVGVVPDSEAEYWKQRMRDVMATTPAWLPGLPLDAEAGIGQNYAEAK